MLSSSSTPLKSALSSTSEIRFFHLHAYTQSIFIIITSCNQFQALPIIEDLLNRNVMPIICGGTNYYIESLVWKVLIDQELSGGTKRKLEDNQAEKGQFLDFDDSWSSEDLYAKLKEVDPERSRELMSSQRRKIVRSLQGIEFETVCF